MASLGRGEKMRLPYLPILMIITVLSLSDCAGLPGREPVHVAVADIQSLPSEGLEIRMNVKLRVQNPNDAPLEFDGVYVKLDVLDKTFATGVSNERGSIPGFGEAVIDVPVTISTLQVGYHALDFILKGKQPEKINYKLSGKLGGPAFGAVRFQADGELTMPKP
jgi:LEA14-like dessication related protein